MFARSVSADEVERVIINGQIIARYIDDEPYPSFLLLGTVDGRALHVVIGYNEPSETGCVITAYEPDNEIWASDLMTRRTR